MIKSVSLKTSLFTSTVSLVTFLGFVNWALFAVIAFVSGFAFAQAKCTRYPVSLSSAAATLGVVVIAIIRDLFESGRVSTKLSGFFSLPHGVVLYFALFLLFWIPSLFAAWSGVSALEAVRLFRDQKPSGK